MAALLADECIQETVDELMVSTKTFYKVKKHLEDGEGLVHKS